MGTNLSEYLAIIAQNDLLYRIRVKLSECDIYGIAINDAVKHYFSYALGDSEKIIAGFHRDSVTIDESFCNYPVTDQMKKDIAINFHRNEMTTTRWDPSIASYMAGAEQLKLKVVKIVDPEEIAKLRQNMYKNE